MEDDFDVTRSHRMELVDKLTEAAKKVTLTRPDSEGNHQVSDDTGTALQVVTVALKALGDVEKANAASISLKLKQNEQAIASSQASKDRMAIILAATAPGRIVDTNSVDSLEEHLEEMFDSTTIKDFELKSSARDLND
jgi:hypothetical protein